MYINDIVSVEEPHRPSLESKQPDHCISWLLWNRPEHSKNFCPKVYLKLKLFHQLQSKPSSCCLNQFNCFVTTKPPLFPVISSNKCNHSVLPYTCSTWSTTQISLLQELCIANWIKCSGQLQHFNTENCRFNKILDFYLFGWAVLVQPVVCNEMILVIYTVSVTF